LQEEEEEYPFIYNTISPKNKNLIHLLKNNNANSIANIIKEEKTKENSKPVKKINVKLKADNNKAKRTKSSKHRNFLEEWD
jgi:hypothetical protein